MSLRRLRVVTLGLLACALAACSGLGQTPPPPPYDINSLATAIKLTENAPPAGYETAAYPVVDAGLDALDGYRYVLEVRFEGVRDSNLEPVAGMIRAEVWWDGIAPARRVLLEASGEAFASTLRDLEAVRIADDYYLVNEDGRCLLNADDAARSLALLTAGGLVGGVAEAPYGGVQAVLNGEQSYRYDVRADAIDVPAIQRGEDSVVNVSGELWIAPRYDLATRYYANIEVSRVTLLEGDQTVSGYIYVRYDLFDIGKVPNISIPFGC